MKILHGGMGAGKTYRVVQWVKECKGRVLLVHSLREKQRLLQLYQLEPNQIIVYGESKDRWRGTERKEVCIDNLDVILYQICSPHTPVMCTMTEWPEVATLGSYKSFWKLYVSKCLRRISKCLRRIRQVLHWKVGGE